MRGKPRRLRRGGCHEVLETDRYSVTLSGPNDERITLSQNLQTGGWAVHEELWWVGPGDGED